MQFLKKNILTLSCMVLILAMAFVGDASAAADGNTLMDTAKTKAKSVFTSVKTIIFIVGGFGLVGLAWAGMVGALAYTFSDTFWFSAVEGEVYAMSSLFTAVIFWAGRSGSG
jgi:hypothetical protein